MINRFKYKHWLSNIAWELCLNRSIPVGWKKHRNHRVNMFYNTSLGLVVKRTYIVEPRTPLHIRIPSIYLKDGWVLQPIARRDKTKRAMQIIRKKLKKHPNIYPDIHSGNVGWYKNRAVLFDW